jgi:hypothetical protein
MLGFKTLRRASDIVRQRVAHQTTQLALPGSIFGGARLDNARSNNVGRLAARRHDEGCKGG